MDFRLSDEQTMLRDALGRFLRDRYDFETRRARVVRGGHDADLWADFAGALGILGASWPEACGGFGGGAVEAMIVQEALGGALVTEPYLETVVVGGGLLRRIDDPRAPALLQGIVAGNVRIALATGEPTARFAIEDVGTRAVRTAGGWMLDGAKTVVIGAPSATHWIVVARTAGDRRDTAGISLFLIDPATAGVDRHDYRLIDGRPAADLRFAGTPLPSTALLGGDGDALPLLDRVLDEAIAALCAEAVGVMRRMLADTIDHCRQRRQFGQPLAAFQVLQHRMVDMYMAVEQAAAAALLATLRLDADPPMRARAASAAKATVGQAIRFVGQNAVQLHGAMGMTEELAVGHYFKRATVIESQFGTVDHHLARYAALSRAAA